MKQKSAPERDWTNETKRGEKNDEREMDLPGSNAVSSQWGT